ncbi:MAG TPA: ribosome-associated translation inhibitor RaiA [Candidatus Borkfalkia excrementigallinarum]|uniref:Ribosome hibernation promoting factor n=1 Tax=Candidatus Borkfalkia excrementigallinarum TaxID=2838506 RepID=A0A9D1ZW38_9FIRM|nr:ribosome-associated translation inhibitor RaiA [Candidatus Borkfalkia excrementigallinarum]
MRIEISEKNCRASEKLIGVVNKKVSRLEKYFDEDAVCTVYLKQESKFVKTELTVQYKGNMVRAEVAADNFYDAIDEVLPKFEKQIYKHKTKLESKLKKDAFLEKQLFFGEAELPESKLVKTKTFSLTPMTTEEAVEQLDLLGHSFYIFQDAETGEVRVVYLRAGGDVGLIVPVKKA